MKGLSQQLEQAGRELCRAVDLLRFRPPVALVYNPLSYAWAPYAVYLERYANARKRVVFLGMNPGPFGMVQTGVPFGEVKAVRDWLKIEAPVSKPPHEHPARPVLGFACPQSEVSGRRLWGLFAARFGTPERFFAEHLVMNYCPLAFLEAKGGNRTPDKLPAAERSALFAACDTHLERLVEVLEPEWVIGIGQFAMGRAEVVTEAAGLKLKLGRIAHPSPANPAANRNWAALAAGQLETLGVWR